MPQITTGSCLCGTVAFQISGKFDSFFLCHCKRCQKGTGSAHAANLFSTAATINWVSGVENIQTYRVPETRHEKSFCKTCGSPVPTAHQDSSFMAVPAGSIDDAVSIRPNAHICFASRAEWDENLGEIERFNGLPG